MADLAIATRTNGRLTYLLLSGEFDLAGIEEFEAGLAAVEAKGPGPIVIDLTDLVFMDSSGLRALVTADDRARKQGRRFAIVPGPPQVRRVFEITQLVDRLDFVDEVSSPPAGQPADA